MIEAIFRASILVQAGILTTWLPVVGAVHARFTGQTLRDRVALGLLGLPFTVAVQQALSTWDVLQPPAGGKIDPRTIAFGHATEALMLLGPVLALSAAGTAALAPSLRRHALAALPGALALTAWGLAVRSHLSAFAWADADAKIAIWTAWQPVHAAFLAGLAAACAVTASRTDGPGRALAVAPLFPLLLWPSWWPWAAMLR